MAGAELRLRRPRLFQAQAAEAVRRALSESIWRRLSVQLNLILSRPLGRLGRQGVEPAVKVEVPLLAGM